MILDKSTGLLRNTVYYPSPHQSARAKDIEIDLLIIHNISLPPLRFGGADVVDFFMGQLKVDRHPYFREIASLKVSSHLFINREGHMVQFVPFTECAWHAGQSSYLGRENCNLYSIGIELEGADHIPYTLAQYLQLSRITCVLMQHYSKITMERVVGHAEVAPKRKTDPGVAFDWLYYKKLVKKLLNKDKIA